MEQSFHDIETDELLRTLVTDPESYKMKGLNIKDIQMNSQKYGKNDFTQKKKEAIICKFIRIYMQPFNLLLLVASILSIVVYLLLNETSSFFLGMGIVSVSILNTLIEFYQEYTTGAILEGFKSLVSSSSTVTREGRIVNIESNEILVGDLLHLKAGEKIPADIRIITANFLKVDNSSLTGESKPQTRKVSNVEKEYINAENMLFAGNLVVGGECSGIVVSIGDNTVLGKIAQMAVSKSEVESELAIEINQYVKRLGLFALCISILFYAIAMFNGFCMADNLSFCIGVFIAFVPQGLPAAVTTLLCIAAKKMAKRNVLVKDLRAVETLGSISLLATDKTGTITQGKMKCTIIWDGKNMTEDFEQWKKYKRIGEIGLVTTKIVEAEEKSTDGFSESKDNSNILDKNPLDNKNYSHGTTNTNYEHSTDSTVQIMNNDKDPEISKVHFKNNTRSSNKKSSSTKNGGNPTEVAIYEFSKKITNLNNLNETIIYEIPFDSERKFQLCITCDKTEYRACIKGAPEKIVKYCSKWSDDNLQVNDKFMENFKNTYYALASQGHRVVAFAEKTINRELINLLLAKYIKADKISVEIEPEEILNDIGLKEFKFLGMVGIVDPPKDGVREAVMKLRLAGIRVMMITGDHPLTAEYIAKKTNILSQKSSDDSLVINGDEISCFTDYDWEVISKKRELVFARTTPSHKLLIVEKFQSFGHIVGVCGDGVNDSPALKRANLGISMNQTGSEASKEAASMILLDDNFTSIVDGVLEGRLVFLNLKKCIRYILSHITPQVIPFLLFVALGVPPPMSSLLLMFIDLFTEFFPAILLAWEEPEGNLMIEAPRKMASLAKIDTKNLIKISSFKNKVENCPYNATFEERHFSIKNEEDLCNIETAGESLCDLDVLLWSYLEAGIITTIGALVTFFIVLHHEGIPFQYFIMSAQHFFKKTSPDLILPDRVLSSKEQTDILFKAQSSYFLSILIGQMFNLLACKRKYDCISLSTFKNVLPIVGSCFGLFFGLFITYSSHMNKLLHSRPVEASHLLISTLICSFILIWDWIRKKMKRELMFGELRDTDALYRLKRSRLICDKS